MRDLLAVSNAANRSYSSEDHRCAGCDCSQDAFEFDGFDEQLARTLLRFQGYQACCDLPSGVPVTRSASEERSLERFAAGDEASGNAGTVKPGILVRDA